MGNLQPLKVTKSPQAYVNLNGMLEDGGPLCKLGIIDKEIACTLASKHDLVSRGNDLLYCGTTC